MRIIGRLQSLLFVGLVVVVAGELAFAGAGQRGGAPLSPAEQVLYRFCPQVGCTDGAEPIAGLIMDGAGNLYGTTWIGGNTNAGVVFKLTPTGAGWTQTVLYSFCAQSNCTDGANPYGGLIMDGAGNLYGTTANGGLTKCGFSCGVVFELMPSATGWTYSVLHSFCAQGSQGSCPDGLFPFAGLIMDGTGNLYGTTLYGGNAQNAGVVFKLTPTGAGWTQTVLYSFCAQSNCTDGAIPYGGLIMDGAGNLYGTTKSRGPTPARRGRSLPADPDRRRLDGDGSLQFLLAGRQRLLHRREEPGSRPGHGRSG